MKNQRETVNVKIDRLTFPCTGYGMRNGKSIGIKAALPGQTVQASVKRRSPRKGLLLGVVERAEYEIPSLCPHFGACGSCVFMCMSYDKQLELKERAVFGLFEEAGFSFGEYDGLFASPLHYEYRNKMEFSFGDTGPGRELSLGMRKKGAFYEVLHVSECMLIGSDMRAVLNRTLDFFKDAGTPYYNTRRAEGTLRHLAVRKSLARGDLLINIVTAKELEPGLAEAFADAMESLEGVEIAGVLHTINTSLADAVVYENVNVLRGNDYIIEDVLGFKFKIAPQSFFQTNTWGAEVLYENVLYSAKYCRTAYDLYCGTGTISLLLAQVAEYVYGIDIVPEAIESAREAAEVNDVSNAQFICGDVLEKIDELISTAPPDLIVLDPPREGVRLKALEKIASLEAEKIVYVSCNPVSLLRDLNVLKDYDVARTFFVDMFPWTAHVECVAELRRREESENVI